MTDLSQSPCLSTFPQVQEEVPLILAWVSWDQSFLSTGGVGAREKEDQVTK